MSALAFPQTSTTRRVGDDERASILAAPGFGQHYTDFMARARWTAEGGWGQDEVVPYGPLELSPASAVLHLSLIHISEPTRRLRGSRMPSSA